MISSVQLARLVQGFLAEPGVSIDQKAAVVGVRRNELLRAARGTISRSARRRLLAYFARVADPTSEGSSGPRLAADVSTAETRVYMSPAPGRAAPGPLWYPSGRSLHRRRARTRVHNHVRGGAP